MCFLTFKTPGRRKSVYTFTVYQTDTERRKKV